MAKKLAALIAVLLGLFQVSNAQLTALYRESKEIQQNQRIFRQLKIAVKSDGSVISNTDSLLFEPTLSPDRYLYELWGRQLLIITELLEGSEIFPMVYEMPKYKLFVIDLSEFNCYQVSLPGCFITKIDIEKQQIRCNEGNSNEIIFDLVRIE